MDRNITGLKESLVFYLILILIVLVAIYFPAIAFILYSLVIVGLYILKNREGGFQWGVSWRFGFLFGFILISLVFILESVPGWVRFGEIEPDALYILTAGVIIELLVSAGEEISFRGYILPNLINSLGRWKAVIMTSVLFTGLHIPSIWFLGIEKSNMLIMVLTLTVAGVLLALLYIAGGLKMSCGFHFSWNFFQYHVFSLRSGFGIFGLTATKTEFTGGSAGPEAGLTGLSVLLLGILVFRILSPGFRKE